MFCVFTEHIKVEHRTGAGKTGGGDWEYLVLRALHHVESHIIHVRIVRSRVDSDFLKMYIVSPRETTSIF